LTTARVDDE